MSSRLPKQDRFSQMSEQAAIIARKKAEIEAKLKATTDGKELKDHEELNVKNSKQTPPGKSSKNRWYIIFISFLMYFRRYLHFLKLIGIDSVK